MEELKKLLELVTKHKVITIVLAAALVACWVLFKSGGDIQDISIAFNRGATTQAAPKADADQADSYRPAPNLEINDIRASPVRFVSSNYLYFRIANSGDADALNVSATIDTGQAKVLSKEVRQSGICNFDESYSGSVVRLACPKLALSSYVDVMLITSDPAFSRIEVHAANQSYSISAYAPTQKKLSFLDQFPGFVNFLEVIAAIVLIILTGAILIKILIFMFGDGESETP